MATNNTDHIRSICNALPVNGVQFFNLNEIWRADSRRVLEHHIKQRLWLAHGSVDAAPADVADKVARELAAQYKEAPGMAKKYLRSLEWEEAQDLFTLVGHLPAPEPKAAFDTGALVMVQD